MQQSKTAQKQKQRNKCIDTVAGQFHVLNKKVSIYK